MNSDSILSLTVFIFPLPFMLSRPLSHSHSRLVLSRFEVESGEGPVESEEDEEEVWLFWKDNIKEIRSKSVRELAQDAREGQKDDQEVISYYRSANSWGSKVISVPKNNKTESRIEFGTYHVFT